MIKLIKGDCMIEMGELPEKSVNLIICDLPYGTTACEWDTIIEPGPLFDEYHRILTDNGTILLFGSEPFSTTLRVAAMDIYRYDHIWLKNKVSGFVHAKNKPMKDFEVISVFSKGTTGHEGITTNKMVYNPQGLIKVENPEYTVNTNENLNVIKVKGDGFVTEYTNYPRMTIKCDFKEPRYHPTQKPTKLYEYLIKTYSNPGDMILDNCAGSGTLGEACMNLGDRDAIMIELEEEYHDVITKRIPDVIVQEATLEPKKKDVEIKRKVTQSKYVELPVRKIEKMKADGKGPSEIAEELGIKWVKITQSLSKRYKKPFNRM